MEWSSCCPTFILKAVTVQSTCCRANTQVPYYINSPPPHLLSLPPPSTSTLHFYPLSYISLSEELSSRVCALQATSCF